MLAFYTILQHVLQLPYLSACKTVWIYKNISLITMGHLVLRIHNGNFLVPGLVIFGDKFYANCLPLGQAHRKCFKGIKFSMQNRCTVYSLI